MEGDRGKPGAITDQGGVFSVSVIKGLPGQAEDLTIICIVVDLKPEPSLRVSQSLDKSHRHAVMARSTYVELHAIKI